MWLSDLILRCWEYASAYFRILRKAGNQLLLANMVTRSQVGRFYWVCLLMTAAALWLMFWLASLIYDAGTSSATLQSCYPTKPLSTLAFFVLAEFASFILLIGAILESKIVVRFWPSTPYNMAWNEERVITRRLHGLMWGWFPIFLLLVVSISQSQLGNLLEDCKKAPPVGFILVTEAIWPGFLIAYSVVVAVNCFIYKWSKSWELGFILAYTFVMYVVVIAVVSPADVLFVVRFCRNLPDSLESGLNFLFKQASL
jgi:hypothetical protein